MFPEPRWPRNGNVNGRGQNQRNALNMSAEDDGCDTVKMDSRGCENWGPDDRVISNRSEEPLCNNDAGTDGSKIDSNTHIGNCLTDGITARHQKYSRGTF